MRHRVHGNFGVCGSIQGTGSVNTGVEIVFVAVSDGRAEDAIVGAILFFVDVSNVMLDIFIVVLECRSVEIASCDVTLFDTVVSIAVKPIFKGDCSPNCSPCWGTGQLAGSRDQNPGSPDSQSAEAPTGAWSALQIPTLGRH